MIDPRGLVPPVAPTAAGSLVRTSRLVTVEENPYQGRRGAGECVPPPFADTLEVRVVPTVGRVMRTVRDLTAY